MPTSRIRLEIRKKADGVEYTEEFLIDRGFCLSDSIAAFKKAEEIKNLLQRILSPYAEIVRSYLLTRNAYWHEF